MVEYWDTAIRGDSQQHAAQLIDAKGLEGMSEYWGQTLSEEAPNGGYRSRIEDGRFLIEMTDCPSRGFLLRNQVEFSKDYCDHCLGWIGPMMRDANFKIQHAHNHLGQCYWEFSPESDEASLSPSVEAWKKSLLSDWKQQGAKIDQSPTGKVGAKTLDRASGREEGGKLYFDAKQLPIEGRGWQETENYYERLPASAKGSVRQPVWDLSKNTAGMLYRFSTDSPEIYIRWSLTLSSFGKPHMPSTGVSGVDLYGLSQSGEWRHIPAVATQDIKDLENQATFGELKKLDYLEYRLYLPLYNGINDLEIGVTLNSSIGFEKVKRKQVVMYGTSITQGGCASRPGLAYAAIVGRKLDVEVINLGFSGNAKLESEMAKLIAELSPDCFVIDPLWNNNPCDVHERYEAFIRTIQQAHPGTPIILVDKYRYDGKSPTEQGVLVQEAMSKLQAEGAKHLSFLPNVGMLGDDFEGCVDGIHPNDIGMLRISKILSPILSEALDRVGPSVTD